MGKLLIQHCYISRQFKIYTDASFRKCMIELATMNGIDRPSGSWTILTMHTFLHIMISVNPNPLGIVRVYLVDETLTSRTVLITKLAH